MSKEVSILQDMKSWQEKERPKDEQILHSKFVLKRKQDKKSSVQKYRARLVICGNKETNNDQKKFSLVTDFSVTCLILPLVAQQGWNKRHIDFQNAFPNGTLDRPVYVEISKYIYTEE